MYATLKAVHVSFAILTVAGFVLRGAWMLDRSDYLDRPLARVMPHVVDTLFLISGIWLIVILRLQLIQQPWLITKLVALVLYVVLGALALRYGKTMRIRGAAFAAALLTYLYIAGVAFSKSPASWLAV